MSSPFWYLQTFVSKQYSPMYALVQYSFKSWRHQGLSWSWGYGSSIYYYLCNQYLSPLALRVQTLYKWCLLLLRLARSIMEKEQKTGWNQDNVFEWGGKTTRGLLFQWASTINIHLRVLIKYKADLIIISLKINVLSPWYSWQIAELALNNNHSLTHAFVYAKVYKIVHWALYVYLCKTS